ncbi:hypothetical protein [Ekhidna sp.]|uniref:hypothetical protein n=1 Tax=Ekhidna sp. TaxID=2608089 RepID=UPI003CCBCE02
MGSQIDKLLEKYWNGETSLEEEKMLKKHFKSNPALTNESHYFRYLTNEKSVKYEGSKGVNKKRAWISAAATVTIGIITAALVFNDAKKDPFAIEDPQKAFEATKNALMMISGELKEGKEHTLELSKFNKAQEELQEDS